MNGTIQIKYIIILSDIIKRMQEKLSRISFCFMERDGLLFFSRPCSDGVQIIVISYSSVGPYSDKVLCF